MTVDEQEVKKIAHLARIAVSADDVAQYANELHKVLALAEQMNAVETQHLPIMSHPMAQAQPLRADVVTSTDQHTLFLSMAPLASSDLYLVPQVIE